MHAVPQVIQSMLDALEDHIAIIDLKGYIQYTNQAWNLFSLENNGDVNTTSVGVNYFDYLDDQFILEHSGIKDVLNNKRQEFSTIYSCHGPDNKRFFRMNVEKCLLLNGQPGAFIRHRNVTKEVQSDEVVADVLESMTDAFMSLNENWKITHLNGVAQRLLNLNAEKVIGKNIWEIYPEAVNSEFHMNYTKTMKEKVYISFESYFDTLTSWFEIHSYPRVDGGVSIYFKNINVKKESEMQKEAYENTNRLTSLPNRKAISEKIEELIESETGFSTMYLDINGFKNINDLYGHQMGDELLIHLAERLNTLLLPYGELSHLGGDDFLIVVKETDRDRIEQIVEDIVEHLKNPIEININQKFTVAVSIGISQFPLDGLNCNQMLSATETAMYYSKQSSEQDFCFYEVNMTEELSKRLTIEQCLQGDLSKEGIYFVLQPQISGITNEMYCFEVLSRWNHSKLGILSPLDFIEIVEESGNMLKLTRYLMEEVFSTVSNWINDFGFDKRVSINVTSSILSKELFFDDLYKLLEKYQIPYNLIELEITEDTRLVTSALMLKNINKCREKGIRIALDDFGTGFSMFSSLTNFPIDKIKIDRYFIQRIGNDPQSEAVLKSIIHLSNSLQCDLVAEGVENEHEITFLMEHGCNFFQGYYFEKPISIEDFQRKYIKNRSK
jgi:diguanylate cyclase (GGDEF)-like protein/PAS domain S-box-containing protein